jgi:hypothetical protein
VTLGCRQSGSDPRQAAQNTVRDGFCVSYAKRQQRRYNE